MGLLQYVLHIQLERQKSLSNLSTVSLYQTYGVMSIGKLGMSFFII